MSEDRYRERLDTPECKRFAATVHPLLEPFLARFHLTQVGPIRYYGDDPKAAGRLFLMFFESTVCRLKLRTVDGGVEILVGASDAPLVLSDSVGNNRIWYSVDQLDTNPEIQWLPARELQKIELLLCAEKIGFR
jgi:hypothetical protein